MTWILHDQIDRNYGLLGGWLLTRMYGDCVVYTDWSPN